VCICLAVFESCTCVSALRALGWLGHCFRDDTYLLTRCYTHFSLLSDVVLIELPELGGLYINKNPILQYDSIPRRITKAQ